MDIQDERLRELQRLAEDIEKRAEAMGLSRARVKEIIASGKKAPVRVPRGRSKLLDAVVDIALKSRAEDGEDWSDRDVEVTVLRRGVGGQ